MRIDNDPNTAAWGLWPTSHHTLMGDVRVDGLPVHLSKTDWEIARGLRLRQTYTLSDFRFQDDVQYGDADDDGAILFDDSRAGVRREPDAVKILSGVLEDEDGVTLIVPAAPIDQLLEPPPPPPEGRT